MLKLFKWLALAISMFFLMATLSYASSITLAWDANTEDDLAGYKIHHGQLSRFEDFDEATKTAYISGQCDALADEEKATCIADLNALCDEADPGCHFGFFAYDQVVDVKNVNEYTISGFSDGTHYFAATAYDDAGNESLYSIELTHIFNTEAPDIVINFKVTGTKDTATYNIVIEKIE